MLPQIASQAVLVGGFILCTSRPVDQYYRGNNNGVFEAFGIKYFDTVYRRDDML